MTDTEPSTPAVILTELDANFTTTASPPLSTLIDLSNSTVARPAAVSPSPPPFMGATPDPRPNVLCLGMSYASMEKQLRSYKVNLDDWLEDRSQVSVQDVLKCVKAGMITEMDARDLARCIATELETNVKIYTVSQEKAAQYDSERHLFANFNRHSFVHQLYMAFATDENGNLQPQEEENNHSRRRSFRQDYQIRYRQAILDYYWIPQGWDDNHWSRSFFTDTLVDLVRRRMLDMGDDGDNNDGNQSDSVPCGVYLPFCFHCFRQIVNALDLLRPYYAISFLRKKDLNEISLWKGTQTIGAHHMAKSLGKKLDQENIYCTFGYQEVMQAGINARDEPKETLIDILSRLEDFDEIRMIKLRPLNQHHPNPAVAKKKHERGGLKGLTDPRLVKRGFLATADPAQENEDLPKCQALVKATCRKKGIPIGLKTPTRTGIFAAGNQRATKRKTLSTNTPSQSKRKKTTQATIATVEPHPTAQKVLRFKSQSSLSMTTRSRAQAVGAPTRNPTKALYDTDDESTPARSSGRNCKISFVSLPKSPKKRRRRSSTTSLSRELKTSSAVGFSATATFDIVETEAIPASDQNVKTERPRRRSPRVLEVSEPQKDFEPLYNVKEQITTTFSSQNSGAKTLEMPKAMAEVANSLQNAHVDSNLVDSHLHGLLTSTSHTSQGLPSVTPSPTIKINSCKNEEPPTAARRALCLGQVGTNVKHVGSRDATTQQKAEAEPSNPIHLAPGKRDGHYDSTETGALGNKRENHIIATVSKPICVLQNLEVDASATPKNAPPKAKSPYAITVVRSKPSCMKAKDRLKYMSERLDPSSRNLTDEKVHHNDDSSNRSKPASFAQSSVSGRKHTIKTPPEVQRGTTCDLTSRDKKESDQKELNLKPRRHAVGSSCRIEGENPLMTVSPMKEVACR